MLSASNHVARITNIPGRCHLIGRSLDGYRPCLTTERMPLASITICQIVLSETRVACSDICKPHTEGVRHAVPVDGLQVCCQVPQGLIGGSLFHGERGCGSTFSKKCRRIQYAQGLSNLELVLPFRQWWRSRAALRLREQKCPANLMLYTVESCWSVYQPAQSPAFATAPAICIATIWCRPTSRDNHQSQRSAKGFLVSAEPVDLGSNWV